MGHRRKSRRCPSLWYTHDLFLLFLRLREKEVEQDTHHGGKSDAAEGEGAKGENGAADAHGQRDGDDDDVTRLIEVDLVIDEILHTHGSYRAEEQQHDASEDGRRDALQQGTELADDGEDDSCAGSDTDDLRMSDTRDLHGTCHLAVGGHWRASHEGGKEAGKAVAQHRTMEAGILHEVLVGHCSNHIDIADVLDDWGDGHGNHEHERLPGELGQVEVGNHWRQREPWGGGNG